MIAVHGPNRIVVRDEKGNKMVRRVSRLKHCDAKTKFASMVPDNKEYEEFGRSAKLLLHTKDVPELQLPEEITTVWEKAATEQLVNNISIESVVDFPRQPVKISKILPDLGADSDNNGKKRLTNSDGMSSPPVKLQGKALEVDEMRTEETWIPFLVTGMSKWSNALKEGMFRSNRGCKHSMATHTGCENGNREFSFFI